MKFNINQFYFIIILILIYVNKSFCVKFQNHKIGVEQNDNNCINKLKIVPDNGSLNYSIQSTWSNFTAKKYGNSYDFGHFLKCQNLITNNSKVNYCLVQYFHKFIQPIPIQPSKSIYLQDWDNFHISFMGAICLPDQCEAGDVKSILKAEFDAKNLSFGGIYCKNIQKPRSIFKNFNHWTLNWWNFERILIFSSILLISIILQFTNLQNFSPINILKDLFAYNGKNSSTAYLNGIKALGTIIVILFHCWISRVFVPFKNGENLDKFTNGIFYPPLWFGNIAMENFFIVGGILATRGLSKGFDEKNKLKWMLKYYLKRIMRLLPITALILLLVVTSDAEFFAPFSFSDDKKNCKKFWWMILAYNFMDFNNYFAHFIWFISAYMQLALAAPFVFWLTKVKNYEAYSSAFIVAASAVLRFLHTSNGFYDKALNSITMNVSFDFYTKMIATQYRLLPFFGGMILGKYSEHKMIKFKLSLVKAFLTFLLTFLVMVITAFINPILFSIAEVLLVLNILLLYYSLHHDSGLIKSFLSHKCWVPISKAGLTAYLVVSYFQFGIHERLVEPQDIQNEFQFILEFIKDILQTFIPVLFVYTLVEEPFSRLGEFLASKI